MIQHMAAGHKTGRLQQRRDPASCERRLCVPHVYQELTSWTIKTWISELEILMKFDSIPSNLFSQSCDHACCCRTA